MPPTLSVIMPVYNEVRTIREAVRQVIESPVDKELLIVEDCSTDGTRDVLRELEQGPAPANGTTWRFFYQKPNQGKGAAVRRAIPEAKGQITIIQDADLEVDPKEYSRVIQPILAGQADVVYGNRFHAEYGIRWFSLYYWGNRFLTAVSNFFSGLKLHDMETCYKAFRTPLLQSLKLESDRFGFEPEVTAKIAKRNVRLVEVPISYVQRTREQGKKIGPWDALQAVKEIIRTSRLAE
jgi:glycosyltransferase involved in cell wall biosynthesis